MEETPQGAYLQLRRGRSLLKDLAGSPELAARLVQTDSNDHGWGLWQILRYDSHPHTTAKDKNAEKATD